MTNLDSVLKSRDITLPTKGHLVKATVFPVVMYGCELGHKEGWAPKNCCFWTMVLEKTLERPLDCKKFRPVNPKGNQSWIVIYGKVEAPILWPPDVKSQLTGKNLDAGKDWRWREGDDRGWDFWMASLTQWTWVWVRSRRWWRTGKPGVLQSIGSKVRHNWATEQQNLLNVIWTNLHSIFTRSRFHLKKLLSFFIHKKQLLIHENFALRLQQFSHIFRLHC